jgi:hypothetical protein
MGLRFERSRGLIALVRWNVRETALMFRLGRLKFAENMASKKVHNPIHAPDKGQFYPSVFTKRLPRLGRMLFKTASMAALFLGRYLTGRLGILDSIPTVEANADQALSAQSGSETRAPLAFAPPVTLLQETSSAPAPVSAVSTPEPMSAPIKGTRPLNRDEVREMQARLKGFGFYAGPVDGLPGPKTTAAVKRYRNARQMEETGGIDRSVLQQVRQQVGQSSHY